MSFRVVIVTPVGPQPRLQLINFTSRTDESLGQALVPGGKHLVSSGKHLVPRHELLVPRGELVILGDELLIVGSVLPCFLRKCLQLTLRSFLERGKFLREAMELLGDFEPKGLRGTGSGRRV